MRAGDGRVAGGGVVLPAEDLHAEETEEAEDEDRARDGARARVSTCMPRSAKMRPMMSIRTSRLAI